jgi:hypothetical protein
MDTHGNGIRRWIGSRLTVNQSGSRSGLLRCVYFPCGTDGCTWSSVELASPMPFASAPIDSVRPVEGKRWRIFEAEDGALSRGSVCAVNVSSHSDTFRLQTSHSAPVIQKSLPSNSVARFDGNSIKSHCSAREIRFVSRKKRETTRDRGGSYIRQRVRSSPSTKPHLPTLVWHFVFSFLPRR